jgi:hypothetical protein
MAQVLVYLGDIYLAWQSVYSLKWSQKFTAESYSEASESISDSLLKDFKRWTKYIVLMFTKISLCSHFKKLYLYLFSVYIYTYILILPPQS